MDEEWLKFTMWKKVKNNLTITSKPNAHPHTMKKMHAKFHNNRYKTVRGVALTGGTNYLYITGEKWLSYNGWKWLSSQSGKSDKKWSNKYIQTTCTSSYHEENPAKFQNDRYKTVRGVALTRGTPCLYIEGEKWLSSQCGSDKKCSNNYTQTTCISLYREENTCKISKQSV